MILTAGTIITQDHEAGPAWIELDGERIVAMGEGRPPSPAQAAFEEGILAPGFVDVHAHGGGGASFSTTSDADIDRVLSTHVASGTTTMIASMVTACDDDLRNQVKTLASRVHTGDLAGIHLEGPWLSPCFKGAHDEALLRDPDPGFIHELLTLADGAIRMVTLAPELPNAQEAIHLLADHRVVVAVGHTNSTLTQCRQAIELGATGATHLFNAMPPVHHRAPGPVLALLEDKRVHVEVVFDNVHVHPELAAFALRTAGERGVLVTDAMSAAGQPDGAYRLGGLDVTVVDGIARLSGSDTIAGSTLTLAMAARNAVKAGLDRYQAIGAATWRPATYLHLEDVGRLAPGLRADLVVLDQQLNVRRVMRKGQWQ